MEDILFKMGIRCEIDGRERDVAEQAGTGSFIQSNYTQLANNMDSTLLDCAFYLCGFSLDLETNLAEKSSQPKRYELNV
jgi:hypothetical protein